MAYKFTDPGTFSILLSLTAPIIFFSSKDTFCCWQEWMTVIAQHSGALQLCHSATFLSSQRDPPLALCSHHVLFPSLRISIFFHFLTPCLKQYLNYIVILAWFFFLSPLPPPFLLLCVAFCSDLWNSWQKNFPLWAFDAGIRQKNAVNTSLPYKR